MKDQERNPLDIQAWFEKADRKSQIEYTSARNVALKLSKTLPAIEFEKMIRQIVKNNGRSSGSFYGFDTVQNPSNYINILN